MNELSYSNPLFPFQLLSDPCTSHSQRNLVFSIAYWGQVMLALYRWVLGHLLKQGHPNRGQFLKEYWHSLPQQHPTAEVPQGNFKEPSPICLGIFTGLLLCRSCAGNFLGKKSLSFLITSSKAQTNHVWSTPSNGTHDSETTHTLHLLFKTLPLLIEV